MAKSPTLSTFEIECRLEDQKRGGIEVVVTLDDGERRWCYFMTPESLANCGDWIDGTTTRFHHSSAHMIVVAAPLTDKIIEAALRSIDRRDGLLGCTIPCVSPVEI